MKITPEIRNILNENSIEICVKTDQKKTELKLDVEKLILYVKSKPENNEANDEIIKYLSKLIGKSAKIVKGKTSKKKIIKFD